VRVSRPASVLARVAVLVILLTGCAEVPATDRPAPAPPSVPAPPPARGGDRRAEPAADSYAVLATRDVGAWSRLGGGELVAVFPARQPWGDESAFLLLRHGADRDGRSWYQVLLPRGPNGSSGWVRADHVRLVPLAYRVDVDLSRRELRLLRYGRLAGRFTVVVGAPGTPTPTGSFFLTAKLQPPRISPVFGSWALALSAWSSVLDQAGTGDGQIALHGTRDPAGLGQALSHGCVRLHDRSVTMLASLLPLGTPVTIRP
jgi:hypothetical protein